MKVTVTTALTTATLVFACGLMGTAHAQTQAAAAASQPPAPPPAAVSGPQALLDASPASHWRRLDPQYTLYMDLPQGRVVIELAPSFAPAHVANMQIFAREGYWSGLEIIRAQDNFVVQWGDAGEDLPGEPHKPHGSARSKLRAEFEKSSDWLRDNGHPFVALPDSDGWADEVGFVDGFPAARDKRYGLTWLAHCYGMVGAGRDNAPDSSTGAQLYAVTGQSPRMLDRNITLVGRVVQGMEILSSIKRGPPPMGFYTDKAERTPILSARLAEQLPASERVHLEILRTDSPTFMQLIEMRRNRNDGWTVRPAGHIDLCNVTVPTRTARAQ